MGGVIAVLLALIAVKSMLRGSRRAAMRELIRDEVSCRRCGRDVRTIDGCGECWNCGWQTDALHRNGE